MRGMVINTAAGNRNDSRAVKVRVTVRRNTQSIRWLASSVKSGSMTKVMLPTITCAEGAMLASDRVASNEHWCRGPNRRWSIHSSHDGPAMQAANSIANVSMVINGNAYIAHTQ